MESLKLCEKKCIHSIEHICKAGIYGECYDTKQALADRIVSDFKKGVLANMAIKDLKGRVTIDISNNIGGVKKKKKVSDKKSDEKLLKILEKQGLYAGKHYKIQFKNEDSEGAFIGDILRVIKKELIRKKDNSNDAFLRSINILTDISDDKKI